MLRTAANLKRNFVNTVSNVRKSFIGLDARLFEAVEFGDLRKVERLIREGADLDCRDFAKNTPLHLAAAIGDNQMVKLLLKNGADINAVNGDGFTPLGVVNHHYPNLVNYIESIGGVI
jgi:hypothetical protein